MAFSALVLLIFSIIALECFPKSDAYTAVIQARSLNGNCVHNGIHIAERQSIKLTRPCEEWHCNPGGKTIAISGCPELKSSEGCEIRKGHGVFPHCCEKLRCEVKGRRG